MQFQYGILAAIKEGKTFKAGEWSSEICDEMKPGPSDLIVKGKSGLCGFHSTNLDFLLRQVSKPTILSFTFCIYAKIVLPHVFSDLHSMLLISSDFNAIYTAFQSNLYDFSMVTSNALKMCEPNRTTLKMSCLGDF